MDHRTVWTTCLSVLTIIVVFAVLHQTKTLFAPILSALLLGIILSPVFEALRNIRIPAALAAFLIVAMALLSIVVLLLLIEPYVTQAIDRAPMIWNEMRSTIEEFKRLLRGIEEMSEDVAEAIEPDGNNGENDTEEAPVEVPSLTNALFYAPAFAAQFMIFTGTLYFFLIARGAIYTWMSDTFDKLGEASLTHATRQVSRYVLTISSINLCLGICTGVVMHFLGMPSPVLWGILAFSLNFVLYLGPIALIGMLLITGIVMFDGPASFAPALLYMSMNAVEAQFVTPTLVGRNLSVNPLLVFLSLVFWLWLWGAIGGIIAIPILIWTMTIAEGILGYTISSGTPGKEDATSSAGATG